jgi:transcriptional regulator with XRE-family HTH domain
MAKVTSFGFGARLKAARIAAGLSQSELAEVAGENGGAGSKQTVSGWEAERHYPKANQLRAICIKLNISVDELVFGDVRDQAKLNQAESAIQALTHEQRMALLAKMLGPAVPDSRVGEFIQPSPRDPLRSDFGELEPSTTGKRYRSKRIEPYHPAPKPASKKRAGEED